MVLLIDNYDSFSYNLYQLLGQLHSCVQVVRNDAISLPEIETLAPTHIVLSPGPGRPENAGICTALVEKMRGTVPILGICLGHQAICMALGAKITYAQKLMHGKTSDIEILHQNRLFSGLPGRIIGARYHSLAVQADTLPETLQITAQTQDGEIMAVQHRKHAIYGLQFHPESILTPVGKQLLQNFLGGISA